MQYSVAEKLTITEKYNVLWPINHGELQKLLNLTLGCYPAKKLSACLRGTVYTWLKMVLSRSKDTLHHYDLSRDSKYTVCFNVQKTMSSDESVSWLNNLSHGITSFQRASEQLAWKMPSDDKQLEEH